MKYLINTQRDLKDTSNKTLVCVKKSYGELWVYIRREDLLGFKDINKFLNSQIITILHTTQSEFVALVIEDDYNLFKLNLFNNDGFEYIEDFVNGCTKSDQFNHRGKGRLYKVTCCKDIRNIYHNTI